MLKYEHAMGHGHANAFVAYTWLSARGSASTTAQASTPLDRMARVSTMGDLSPLSISPRTEGAAHVLVRLHSGGEPGVDAHDLGARLAALWKLHFVSTVASGQRPRASMP